MVKLPGGFSPWQAVQQVVDDVNFLDGSSRDRDIFADRGNQVSKSSLWEPVGKAGSGFNPTITVDPTNSSPTGQSGSNYYGSGGSQQTAQTAAERAQYDDQINYINSLLGGVGARRDAGLGRLDASYNDAKNRMTEQQTKDMKGYDEQSLKNTQNRQKGIDQVDQFANDSYTSLQRLLQGAGAGNSSVARDLVPRMVSKAAGTRRQGVIDTAGENEAAIVNARKDAEDQYRYNFQDQENQYKEQKQNFLEGILGQENELINKRMAAEAARAAANGGGYAAARAATAQSRADLDARTAQLNSLFGQYAPSFTAKAMNLKTPDLAQYQVDRAQITGDQSVPSQYRAYLPQIKKREEEL